MQTISIETNKPYFRITSKTFKTARPSDWPKVVNGEGSRFSDRGSRWAPKIAETVYLGETIGACFAEKMFYLHREILQALDELHKFPGELRFTRDYVLWEVVFRDEIGDIYDLTHSENLPPFQIFPSLVTNPSQDYEHLRDRRTAIQSSRGYRGLRAPSSRCKVGSNMIVLFEDQSQNIAEIKPHLVQFRLITEARTPFHNHASDYLDFTAGDVRIIPTALPAPPSPYSVITGSYPPGGDVFQDWQRVEFHH